MNLLLVIDLQNEFINQYSKSAINDISDLIRKNTFDKIIFTRFINDKNNPCYKIGRKWCLSKKSQNICIDTWHHIIVDKWTYTAYNEEIKNFINKNNIKNIYLCGIDAECCVYVTALNMFENNLNVFVLKDYIYSTIWNAEKNQVIEMLKRSIWDDYVL